MWLRVPQDYHDVLWEVPLEPETTSVLERWQHNQQEKGKTNFPVPSPDQLPLASVGKPEVWFLPDVFPKKEMPREFRKKLDEADFYLVRLACSFRPRHKEIAIEWARYTLFLHSFNDQAIIAYDLHPLSVVQEIKKDVKVSLSPTLKFSELEANIGNVSFGIEYPELQPIISGSGAGEPIPSWDYAEGKGYTIQGTKFMHVLLKAPKDAKPLQATAGIVATLRAYGSPLNVVMGLEEKEARSRLGMTLVA